MNAEKRKRVSTLVASCAAALLTSLGAGAATQPVDLDGQTANGAESACELDVLGTFPVKIQNVVTNKAINDAFNFSWKSAGPGGFTSSASAGSSGGVGATWTWTTNNTVYAYTGNSCDNDVCFSLANGPDQPAGTCSLACLNDGVSLTVTKGANLGDVVLNWTGGTGAYTVYRSSSASSASAPANQLGTTANLSYSDSPPAGVTEFYLSRAATCLQPKSCRLDADCNPTTEGTCVSRGPFAVPGRSLTTTSVTVSSASLTSSLITFFSPPTEVFHVTSSATPGGVQQTQTNNSDSPITTVAQEYPPGCCPANADVPHQLRCGDACVDYLNDPNNCGACGNTCHAGSCCTNGNCASLCGEGQTWCNGKCVDFNNDSANCGACGNSCGDGSCCSNGACASKCGAGQTWCNGQCVTTQSDNNNCGSCGASCGSGTCCSNSTCASVCGAGQTFCNGKCDNLQSDNNNCGACGHACASNSCCNGGSCVSLCPAGDTYVNGQCYDLADDSNNCGSVGHVCGSGTCCNGGVCASVCPVGQVFCNGQCVDLKNDSSSCGTCGHACGTGTCCNAGVCASECSAGLTYCSGQCDNLQTDKNNCGACGHRCDSDDHCVSGQCREGDDLSSSPSSPAVCPNPHPTHPIPGSCPNPHPSSGPVAPYCPNSNPTGPVDGYCPTPNTTGAPGSCPNPYPSFPVAGSCPNPGPPAPEVSEAPVCQVNASTTTVPAGATTTTCQPGGVLFTEVPSAVSVCGDTVPGPDGSCAGGTSHVSRGTFMRLVPDTTTPIGDAFLTPFAVHVTADASGDGLLQPGETATLVFDVLNAGRFDVTGATATLTAEYVQLVQGLPGSPFVGIIVLSGDSSYGTIPGTVPTTDCTPPALHPASNTDAFQIMVPAGHPGDTSHPFTLQFSGTANGNPFSMSMPISIGIAHSCNYDAGLQDYDGLDGLLAPLAKLVPTGEPVPFPDGSFAAGVPLGLGLHQLCGEVSLTDHDINAPQIVALSEAVRGPIDIAHTTINDDDNSSNPFFHWNDSTKKWIFDLRTSQLGTGSFTVTIRIASRKDYVSGFVLH